MADARAEAVVRLTPAPGEKIVPMTRFLLGTLPWLLSIERATAHELPKTKLTAALVQSYSECTAPTATTNGRPACEPATPVDTVCRLGHEGTGTLAAAVKGTGIRVKVTLKGLSETCEGTRLAAALRLRTTTHCPSEHCTTTDETLVSTVTCTVAKGKCTIKDTLPTGLVAGDEGLVQVLSCGVRNGPLESFSCGLLVP